VPSRCRSLPASPTVRSGAVQLFEMRKILLHCLEFAKAHDEGLHRALVFVHLLPQLLDGFASRRHFSFCFGNCGSLTRGAFRFDLLFEIVEPPARRLYRRIQIEILRGEPLLEVAQFLAQLRGALLHIRYGRVVLGGDDPLAGRSGTPCCTQLSLGRRQFALGLIEVGGRPLAADNSWFSSRSVDTISLLDRNASTSCRFAATFCSSAWTESRSWPAPVPVDFW